MFNFKQQVILVTGGSGNLGAAVVQALASAGASLIVPDRSHGRLASLFPTLANSNDHWLADDCNATEPDQMEQLVEQAMARFGHIDGLVNTVGSYKGGTRLHETSLETWDSQMALNARGIFVACRAVIPAMLAQKRGNIVNIASGSALHGEPGNSAYSASKSAAARMTESMASEYKRDGINVNSMLPGTIDTPQNRAAAPSADYTTWITPDALAQIILFLLSEDARPINGVLIPVYGQQ